MITLEIGKNGEVAYLHIDSAGIDQLKKELNSLKTTINSGVDDHIHLTSEDWGGTELSNQPQAKDGSTNLIHHLKTYGWS